MKKIVFIGDSLTDMGRNRDVPDFNPHSYGNGYLFFIEGELATKYPYEYALYNRGISGNKSVDIYARMKKDCWNLQPNIVSCLFGINDLAFDVKLNEGVEVKRYERTYRAIAEETRERFPQVQFIFVEPIMLKGTQTEGYYEGFLKVREYASIVKSLAQEYNGVFVPLQDKFDELAKIHGAEYLLYDGVHPTVAGAKIIADEWMKEFNSMENKAQCNN